MSQNEVTQSASRPAEESEPGHRSATQDALARLYSKSGARYIEVLTGVFVGGILVTVVPGFMALLVPYFHATASQYWHFVAAFEMALTVAGLVVFVFALRRHAPLVSWVRGERSEALAPAAWESAVAAVPGTTLIAQALYVLCTIPAAIYVSDIAGLSLPGALLLMVFLLFLYMGVSTFAYLFFEQALGPVTREIAAYLPVQFRSRRGGASLGKKLLLLLPAINIFTGSVVAAVSTNSLGLEGRMAVTLAASLLVGLTLSLVLTLMFRQSLLLRLRVLQDAIGRVDRGDYDTRVPYLAGDELDEVGDSFNRMAAGLSERGLLQEALSSYVDESIAAQVISRGETLQGRELEVTVMFLDIRDFTSFADRSSAGEVVQFLGGFFDLIIPIIRAHHGHPNKLLGDGLLAVFGAPAPLDGHADHAIEAARKIVQAVRSRYEGLLRIGIGVHSGEVVAGTIGGGGKLDYTLIGDTVNVAARVEELTKHTEDTLLITAATRELMEEPAGIEARGAHRLRGKEGDTVIHAVSVAAAPLSPRRSARARTRPPRRRAVS